jgi:acyl carrier protein
VSTDAFEEVVRRALVEVAPDIDGDAVAIDDDFHDDLGLDSMDALNLAIALHEATGIDVPERDYPKITSIATCVAYLRGRGGA